MENSIAKTIEVSSKIGLVWVLLLLTYVPVAMGAFDVANDVAVGTAAILAAVLVIGSIVSATLKNMLLDRLCRPDALVTYTKDYEDCTVPVAQYNQDKLLDDTHWVGCDKCHFVRTPSMSNVIATL